MFRYIALGRENFQGNAVYGDFNFVSDVYRRWIAQGIVSLESWTWTDAVAYSGIGIPICIKARRRVAFWVTLCPIAMVASQSAGPYTGISMEASVRTA